MSTDISEPVLPPVQHIMQLAAPRRSLFFRIFTHPRLRPPVVEEMMADLNAMIDRTVRPYTCSSNVLLHEEDLRGVCLTKLAELIAGGALEKCPTRAKFFAMAKVSFKRVVASWVQREAFTQKRTGQKAPPRGEHAPVADFSTATSSVRVSLDDPDSGVQLEDMSSEMPFSSEILDDLKVRLTAVERMVVDQVVSPNVEACQLAWIDAQRGGSSTKVTVTFAHQAAGLGLDYKVFRKILSGIRPKLVQFMQEEKQGETPEQLRVRLAEATLKSVFGLQIPPSTDAMVKRRIFTLAARNQREKVNNEVAELLEDVQALPPVMLGSKLSCYGVLWQKNDKICESCMMQERCKALTVNIGLGEMLLDPELMGQGYAKIPVIGPRPASSALSDRIATAATDTDTEAEVLNYLDTEFKRTDRFDGLWYSQSFDGPSVYLFRAGRPGERFRLMFHAPSESLRLKLTLDVRAYYLPDGISAEAAKDMIDQHANEVLGAKHAN